jgi:hypothetical protein
LFLEHNKSSPEFTHRQKIATNFFKRLLSIRFLEISPSLLVDFNCPLIGFARVAFGFLDASPGRVTFVWFAAQSKKAVEYTGM